MYGNADEKRKTEIRILSSTYHMHPKHKYEYKQTSIIKRFIFITWVMSNDQMFRETKKLCTKKIKDEGEKKNTILLSTMKHRRTALGAIEKNNDGKPFFFLFQFWDEMDFFWQEMRDTLYFMQSVNIQQSYVEVITLCPENLWTFLSLKHVSLVFFSLFALWIQFFQSVVELCRNAFVIEFFFVREKNTFYWRPFFIIIFALKFTFIRFG